MSHKGAIKFRRVKIKKSPLPKGKIILFIFLGLFFLYFMISFFNNTGLWNAGSVISENSEENKTATIRAVIEVDDAEHLGSERNFISDITNEVKELDGIWSEEIPDGHYVRVTFEKELTSGSDITIYPRVVNGEPRIEVYEINGTELIAEFTPINSNEYNKVYLTNLIGTQDTFDLKILEGDIEINYIVDPGEQLENPSFTGGTTDWTLSVATYDPDTFQDSAGSIVVSVAKKGAATTGYATQVGYDGYLSSDAVDFSCWHRVDVGTNVQFWAEIEDQNVPDTWVAIWTSDLYTTNHDWTSTGNLDVSGNFGEGNYRLRLKITAEPSTSSAVSGWLDNCSLFTTAPNDPPTISGLPDVSDDEDFGTNNSVMDLWVYADDTEDPDDVLTYAIVSESNASVVDCGIYDLHYITCTSQANASGYSEVNVSVNDTGAKSDTDVFIFTVDPINDPPWVSGLPDPTNLSYNSGLNQDVISSTDINNNFRDVEEDQNPTGVTISSETNTEIVDCALDVHALDCTVQTGQSGTSTVTLNYTDSEGLWITNSIDVSVSPPESIKPIPSFGINPVNTYNDTDGSIIFELKCSDNVEVDTLQLWGNWTGIWHANQTNSSPVNNTIWSIQVDGIPQGKGHVWAVWCNDSVGNENMTGTNRTFTVDSIGPTINTEGANETNISQNEWFCLNITATDVTSSVDTVYAEVWNTTHTVNYTMLDDGTTTCDGILGDTIYGIEIQGTAQGIWNYSKAHANDTLNNWNSYDFAADLTINVTTPLDTNYPQFSNFQEDPGNNSDYSYGQSYQFNSTVTYTNGTIFLSFEGTNYSATNDTATNFYVDITSLSAENYNYYWWGYGNGTTNKYNSSSVRVYVVQKINPAASLMNNDSWTVTYPTTVKVNYSESNEGDGGVVYKVYRDGIDKGSGETVTLGYENYNYVLNTTGGTNYTANSSIDAETFTVNKNTGACDILFNETSPKTYPVIFKVWTNCTSGFVLYRNGTGIDNNSVQNLAASSYNFTVIRNDTVNYSNYYDEKEFVVNKGTSEIATYIDNVRNNESVLLYSEKWLNATLITPGSGTIKLYYNDTLINQGASPLANLTNFTQEGEFNVSGIYDGNENYTSDIETWWVTVSTDSAPTVNIVYPDNTTYNSDVTQLNYTADDDISLSHCWYSLNGGVTNSSPDATCSNYTGLTSNEGSNNWTVWANDSINQIGSDMVFFTKDTTYPQFSNYQRAPSTPNEDQNVQVNVTITETNKDTIILEWGGTTNYTVTTNVSDEYYFTITSGNYTAHDSITYFWYANDTAGNLNKSAEQGFTVANQIPSVDAPAINDTTPETNDVLNCTGGDFLDDDEYDEEQNRYFKWYDTDVEISGQTSQTLSLTVSGLDKGDVIKCSVRVYDGYDNSTWTNSSNTATIQNSPPVITNPQTTVSWDANDSTYNYDYEVSDADSGDSFTWYDNTSLFDINSGTGIISDIPTEDQAGSYEIKISVSDGTINATDEFTYTINDVTSPSIDFQPPTETNESQLTRDYIQVNVTASDVNGIDTITVYLYNQTSLVNQTTNPTSPYFVNFTNLPDEFYYFNATVNDTSGNTNQTETRIVSTDTGAPTVNYVSPTEDSGVYKNQNYVEINVTASDPNLDKIVIRLYNSVYTQINNSVTSSSPNYINFSNLSDGLYYYNATANDTFGNQDSLTTRNITLDTVFPLIDFTTGTETNGTTHSRDWIFVNVTVTEDNEDTITFSLYNQTSLVNETDYTDSTREINWTSLGNEIYYYNVTVNDTAGNSNNTETRKIILDTEGPQVSSLTESPTDPADYSESGTYMFNATVTDPSLDLVWVDFNGTHYTATNMGDIYNITLSDLGLGTYDYRWYANDSFSNLNDSENGTYTINQATPSLNLAITPSTSVEYGTETTANGTGCPNQLTCNLYRDSVFVNTPEIITLAVGTYNYTYNTTGNTNYTSASVSDNLTITQNTGACDIVFNDTSPVDYGITFKVWTNCTSDFTLYRNGTTIENNSEQNLAASSYNFTVIRTDDANYSNIYDEEQFVINQGTGEVYTWINNQRANITIEQYTEIYLNATLQTGQAGDNITLYNNGTLINQGASPLSNLTNFTTIYLYNITTIYDGNENYTSAYETWWVNVSEADVTPPQVSITYPQNTSYNSVQTQLNYTAWDNFGLNECWYSLNNGVTNKTITCGNNVTDLNSGQESSTWWVYANDAKGNENSSSVTFFVDSINPTISFVSPTKTSGSSTKENYIEINSTANDTNLDTITIYLYNSTSLLETNTSTSPYFINYTGLSAETYYYNATANDTLGNNISTETRNISLVLPELTIIKPENETYIDINNLLLNYTADYEDYVKYNIDQIGDNITISGNTTFNTTEGQHTLYLYANNTLGETARNVTFSVDINKFVVIYNEFKDEGESIDFNQSSYEDLQNLSNVVLENTDYGKIQFNEIINVTDDANVSDNEIDFDTYINISSNNIELDSTALPNFNKSATLYFYNLSLSNPRILRDDSVCPDSICTKISYSGGTLIFNVTQFTVYSAEETLVVSEEEPSVGGGSSYECTEDIECEEDEVCWIHQCVKLFDIKIIDFDSPVQLGEFFEFTYFVKGMANIYDDVEIHFWIEKDGKTITSGSDTIYLGSFEEKTETTKIFLPSNVKSGVYQFYVKVYHQAYQAKSHRTIEIQVKDGIAVIGGFELGVIQKYLIIFLIALIIVIIGFIAHFERKKIKMGLVYETRWIRKHKISVLTSLLAVILGFLLYYVGFFEFLAIKFSEAVLWFKANIPYLIYGILILGLIIIIASIFRSKKIREEFSGWRKRRRKEKFFKRKYYRSVREARKKFFGPKKRLSKKVIGFTSKVFSRAGFLVRRLERGGLRAIKKTEKEIPKVISEFEKDARKVTIPKKDVLNFISPLRKGIKKFTLEIKKFFKEFFKKRTAEKPEKKPKIVHKKKTERKKHIFKKLYNKFSSGIKKAGSAINKFFIKTEKLVREEIRKEKPLKEAEKFESAVLRGKKEISKEGTKFIKKTEEMIDETYGDLLEFLNKLFGKKTRRIIIKDFEEFFAPKNKRIIKKHLGTLGELEKLRKLSKKKIKRFSGGFSKNFMKEVHQIRKKVALLIDDLSEFLKDNELIQTKKERKKIEQMVKTYSKEISFARKNFKKVPINTKYFLKRSDEYIYESLDSFKKEVGKILKRFKKEKNAKASIDTGALKKKPETEKDIIFDMAEKEEKEEEKKKKDDEIR